MKCEVERVIAVGAVLALTTISCGSETDSPSAQPSTTQPTAPQATVEREPTDPSAAGPGTQAITFSVDGFDVVGDLVIPGGDPPHPVLVIVSGSGGQTRTSTPGYSTLLSKFGDAGYAVFSWDKPGSGDSTGEFESGQTLRQRAAILVEAIDTVGRHDAIDAGRIGLWGLSQAGWVMPLALEQTDRVAFMISVSGGGEDSIEQGAYQLGMNVLCAGGTPEDAETVGTYGAQAAKGTTYELYVEAMETLQRVDGLEQFMSVDINDEDDWQPWPPEIDAYEDPIDVIEHTTIPVLAIFGENDRSIDPVQGAAAYERALAAAGNESSRVELIPGVGHTMQNLPTPCSGTGTTSSRYLDLLDEWIVQMATT
jgi:pimeloyl-ACP methyl ester carboxylesterase